MRLPRTVTAAVKPDAGRRPAPDGRRLRSSVFRPLGALALAALVVGALGLTLGLRGLASDEPDKSLRLHSLAQKAGPLVVFSEFGVETDTLWAADPDDPANRIQLGRVDHAPHYGISPRLSPDGARIAYTVLPPDAPGRGPDAPAELWVLETAGGAPHKLAEGVDLLITPVWSPASDAVVVRRSQWQEEAPGSFQLSRIDLEGAAVPVAAADADLFPIDFSPDGAWLYYAVLSPAGTDLARATALGGGAETVAHLSDGFSRDWHLSPDGTRLAYLAETGGDDDIAFVTHVLDLSTGQVQTPLASAGLAQFGPIWERAGGLTIGRLDGPGGDSAPVRLTAEGGVLAPAVPTVPGSSAAGAGFDVPLSWSPDGTHLAVRSFEGASLANPGPSRVVVVGADGRRHQLSPLSDVTVAGWLEASE